MRPQSSTGVRAFAKAVAGAALLGGVAAAPAFAQTQPARETGPAPASGQQRPASPDDSATEVEGVTVTGQAPVQQSTNPRLPAPLLDTPRTLSVIPESVIRQSGALSLQDTLRNVPGITLGAGEGGTPINDRPLIRGFDAGTDIFVDGVRDSGTQTREIFDVASVEVLQGPSGAFTGRGGTGGSININSKLPVAQEFLDAGLTLGTDRTRRVVVDVNRLLNETTAVRVNLMGHANDVAGRDGIHADRQGAAAALTFGLGQDTSMTLNFYHLVGSEIPDYGIPLYPALGRPADVDRSNFYGLLNRDFRDYQTDAGFVRFSHALMDNLQLRVTARDTRSLNRYIATNPDEGFNNLPNGLVYRGPKSRNSVSNVFIAQADLTGYFDSPFGRNNFATGFEVGRESSYNNPYQFILGPTNCATGFGPPGTANCTSLRNPTPNDPYTQPITRSPNYTRTLVRTNSIYAFDTIDFTSWLSATLGARLDDYSNHAAGRANAGIFSFRNDSSFVNGQAALVFKPNAASSIYISYGTSSNPSGANAGEGVESISLINQDLDPERNRSYEIGGRWEPFGRLLTLGGAIFRSEKVNARINNPLGGTQLLVGVQRVDGVSLSAVGRLTENWEVIAGYAYLDSQIVNGGPTHLNEGRRFPNVPLHSFSLFTVYEVRPRYSIGGGAYYVSSRFTDPANTITLPSYWRVDLNAQYRINEHLQVQFNIQNVFNERYFLQPLPTEFTTVAPGRSALLTLNASF